MLNVKYVLLATSRCWHFMLILCSMKKLFKNLPQSLVSFGLRETGSCLLTTYARLFLNVWASQLFPEGQSSVDACMVLPLTLLLLAQSPTLMIFWCQCALTVLYPNPTHMIGSWKSLGWQVKFTKFRVQHISLPQLTNALCCGWKAMNYTVAKHKIL